MTQHVQRTAPLSKSSAQAVAQGLGWFSIALGLAELVAARSLTRTLGMEGSEALVRAYGVREIATGIGILASDNPAPWMWGRVAGDGLDIATLVAAMGDDNPKRENVGVALAAVAGVTLLDALCAQSLSAHNSNAEAAHRQGRVEDYSRRSGFRASPAAMRGAARDFQIPRDMQTPEALKPWTTPRKAATPRSRVAAG